MPSKLSPAARARKIKLLLFDVDGVLTDGKLYFVPEDSPPGAVPSPERTAHSQIEVKGFHAHDGVASSLSRIGGLKSGLITRRISETVARRARDLKIEYIRQGIQDKRACLEEIVKREGLKAEEACFVGDDVVDLPAMRAAGLAIAVQNARAEVKKEAHYVTPHGGGDGSLPPPSQFILQPQGNFTTLITTFIGE